MNQLFSVCLRDKQSHLTNVPEVEETGLADIGNMLLN